MNLDLHVRPAGKATATATFSQDQVDAIRGRPGRGRAHVVLQFEGHTFRTSIAVYRGAWRFVVNKDMRAAGLRPGGTFPVTLAVDTAPKRADPAPDVLAALRAAPGVHAVWEALSVSRRREHLRQIEGAKRAETRARRIAKLVDGLGGDR